MSSMLGELYSGCVQRRKRVSASLGGMELVYVGYSFISRKISAINISGSDGLIK